VNVLTSLVRALETENQLTVSIDHHATSEHFTRTINWIRRFSGREMIYNLCKAISGRIRKSPVRFISRSSPAPARFIFRTHYRTNVRSRLRTYQSRRQTAQISEAGRKFVSMGRIELMRGKFWRPSGAATRRQWLRQTLEMSERNRRGGQRQQRFITFRSPPEKSKPSFICTRSRSRTLTASACARRTALTSLKRHA